MPLPYTHDYVPFDKLLASQMDGQMANDVALADGTALGDGAVTPTKIGLTVLASVRLSSSLNLINATTQTVVFDTVDYDVGNDYSTTTGKFTVPVAGYYRVYTNIRVKDVDSSENCITLINKNTTEMARHPFAPGISQSDMGMNLTKILHCTVGDDLYIQQFGAVANEVNTNSYAEFQMIGT